MLAETHSIRDELKHYGFAIFERLIEAESIQEAIASLDRLQISDESLREKRGSTVAVRNILKHAPELQRLADHAVLCAAVKSMIGRHARLVRAILFDKNAHANWSVPWHQDITIALKERFDIPGFGPWSIKAGVAHCQPPAVVLENMVTARVHLDDCDESNGALHVIPTSQRHGILSSDQIAAQVTKPSHRCDSRAGGVLFMRPLILHSSRKATSDARRRVLHLEFAGIDLPAPLQWAEPHH